MDYSRLNILQEKAVEVVEVHRQSQGAAEEGGAVVERACFSSSALYITLPKNRSSIEIHYLSKETSNVGFPRNIT